MYSPEAFDSVKNEERNEFIKEHTVAVKGRLKKQIINQIQDFGSIIDQTDETLGMGGRCLLQKRPRIDSLSELIDTPFQMPQINSPNYDRVDDDKLELDL